MGYGRDGGVDADAGGGRGRLGESYLVCYHGIKCSNFYLMEIERHAWIGVEIIPYYSYVETGYN